MTPGRRKAAGRIARLLESLSKGAGSK